MLNAIKNLRIELEKGFIADFAKRHGIMLRVGRCTYSDTGFTLKLEGSAIVAGAPKHPYGAALLASYKFLGLAKGDLKRTFTLGGTEYRLVGYNPRRRQCMCIQRVRDGKEFIAHDVAVCRALGHEPSLG